MILTRSSTVQASSLASANSRHPVRAADHRLEDLLADRAQRGEAHLPRIGDLAAGDPKAVGANRGGRGRQQQARPDERCLARRAAGRVGRRRGRRRPLEVGTAGRLWPGSVIGWLRRVTRPVLAINAVVVDGALAGALAGVAGPRTERETSTENGHEQDEEKTSPRHRARRPNCRNGLCKCHESTDAGKPADGSGPQRLSERSRSGYAASSRMRERQDGSDCVGRRGLDRPGLGDRVRPRRARGDAVRRRSGDARAGAAQHRSAARGSCRPGPGR